MHVFGEENLVKNGDFEEQINNLPLYWQPDGWNTAAEYTRFSIGSENPHSGKSYVSLDNIKSNDSRFIQTVLVEPNTVYKLSCWIRSQTEFLDSTDRTTANITIMQENFFQYSTAFPNTHREWKYVEYYVRTSPHHSSMVVAARLGGFGSDLVGKADFDDFRLEKMTDPGNLKYSYLPDPKAVSPEKDRLLIQSIAIIAVMIGAAIIALLIIFLVNKKSHTTNLINTKQEKVSYTKLDWILCWSLMIVYSCIAFINLGAFKVPQSYWLPGSVGEYFYVDFGSEQNLQRIYYYEGLDAPSGESKLVFESSNDAVKWENFCLAKIGSQYYWNYSTVNVNTRYVRVIADNNGFQLKELVFIGNSSKEPIPIVNIFVPPQSPDTKGSPQDCFDEQDAFAYRPSLFTGMTPQFDEIYFARTPAEQYDAESTHPPLGKFIITTGIAIFGMTPFGWRIAGVTFGIFMIGLMFIVGKRLFKTTEYAFIAAFIMAFDCMHFVQSRLTTIDTYGVFFIILTYFFMYKYYTIDFYNTEFKKTLVPLLLSGISWALAVSNKWNGLYAAVGLAVLFFVTIGRRVWDYGQYQIKLKTRQIEERKKDIEYYQKNFPKHLGLTFLWCILVFIVIPITIYTAMYIPFILRGHTLADVWQEQVNNYKFHSGLAPGHPFNSQWFQWPIMWKPVWYNGASDLPPNKTENLYGIGNPAVWWIGTLALVAMIITAFIDFIRRIIQSIPRRKKSAAAESPAIKASFLRNYFSKITDKIRLRFYIITAFASQYLIWAISPRKEMFIYHYFPSVPFIIFGVVYYMMSLKERALQKGEDAVRIANYIIYFYLAVVLILFCMFYPMISNIVVDKSYMRILKWLPDWSIDY